MSQALLSDTLQKIVTARRLVQDVAKYSIPGTDPYYFDLLDAISVLALAQEAIEKEIE